MIFFSFFRSGSLWTLLHRLVTCCAFMPECVCLFVFFVLFCFCFFVLFLFLFFFFFFFFFFFVVVVLFIVVDLFVRNLNRLSNTLQLIYAYCLAIIVHRLSNVVLDRKRKFKICISFWVFHTIIIIWDNSASIVGDLLFLAVLLLTSFIPNLLRHRMTFFRSANFVQFEHCLFVCLFVFFFQIYRLDRHSHQTFPISLPSYSRMLFFFFFFFFFVCLFCFWKSLACTEINNTTIHCLKGFWSRQRLFDSSTSLCACCIVF
jgi:hypothetical protein